MNCAKSFLLFIFLITINHSLLSQKVGLVLSGGGAKGLAHIGVLKALEENDIPIDYIVGTSMGGVVGGFYASGYNAFEIDSIARSPEFQSWINGTFPDNFNTFYFEGAPNPSWLEINLGVDSTFEANFRPQVANDLILNFTLAEFTAKANQVAGEDFNKLFVPFKAVGAEIFTQKSIYMDSGKLGEALRATMSVPFVYKPVKIDGKFIFDGGIYDNFPATYMREAYQPDFLIGVNVSTKIFEEYPENDKKLISTSLLYMIMDKVDPKDLGEEHAFIEPNLEGITGFDFSKASQIIDSGYAAATKVMPSLLKSIEERRSQEELKKERKTFKENMKPLKFSAFGFTDFRDDERNYIKKIINPLDKNELDIAELKANYFRLVADPYFSSVFPAIGFDSASQHYKFDLSSEGEENLRLNFGGNVASSGLSNFYLGAGFDHLNYLLFNHNTSLSIGQFYKSFQYNLKIQFPFGYQFYAEPFFKYNGWDFLNTGNFLDNRRVIPINQFDRNYGVKIGIPIFDRMKLEFKSSLLRKVNEYTNNQDYITTDTLDFNRFYGLNHDLTLSYSNLNDRIFPTSGSKIAVSLSHNYGVETFIPGSTSEQEENETEHNWFQLNAEVEKYYSLKFGDLGFSLTAKASNLKTFSNYRGTLLNTPAYSPTFESLGLYLENFRSPLFMAGGLKYQIKLYKDFHFRLEGHAFKPLIIWEENEAIVSRSGLVPNYNFSGMGALFYQSPIGPISVSGHYYDDQTPFLLLFNIGYLMFNKKPLE
ncbi:patatin [Marivirga tractuosa]|uniref:Patatin n=1 Tax=Marivirga tractuosa (strain ATCC 23168 / DSM 4126 / NBRC 15989 / NCIMB 1408 / VKM B-1430 / H-43) TaxID=643867 RepID=E4TSS9_MARTH|nr:patatin-like phospholipase family protein [Marivirga tractuosa]ADR21889.1 Patatin [Marivirga tractuosa DSM 4126]BDD13653.1 patatin [Marivirga tractuosa]